MIICDLDSGWQGGGVAWRREERRVGAHSLQGDAACGILALNDSYCNHRPKDNC